MCVGEAYVCRAMRGSEELSDTESETKNQVHDVYCALSD